MAIYLSCFQLISLFLSSVIKKLTMDVLKHFYVSIDMSTYEFLRHLRGVPEDLSAIIEDIFKIAIENGLADMGEERW